MVGLSLSCDLSTYNNFFSKSTLIFLHFFCFEATAKCNICYGPKGKNQNHLLRLNYFSGGMPLLDLVFDKFLYFENFQWLLLISKFLLKSIDFIGPGTHKHRPQKILPSLLKIRSIL